ncbi:gluconeogenesis factor YvcK family protein [Nesterenkonia natronophila]|uniref:Putative gluconeogenesis factor n=1 Tax=Nesterenkonia natronophila TaxID=2174932 RepID=A0A3A4F0X1_9MICC|nr:uridine diphosphate-N-acetylglucosamine-binding protein YvcK [Nesterenkonia natronophila]
MNHMTGPVPTLSTQPMIPPMNRSTFRVTALGGGHGLSATLKALRIVAAEHLTAICTVADDGGSSGRLRKDMDVLPPGDLRMALTALCDDTDWGRTWADVMQHRFRSKAGISGSLDDHAMGNLLIVALWELLGDSVDGLRWAGALLGARGQVLPMSRTPLSLSGMVHPKDGGRAVRMTSQADIARAGSLGRLTDLQLDPQDAEPCLEAVTSIELADWVVFGPGSWYTSVLPHLLLDGLRIALGETEAKRCIVMNLKPDTAETSGMSPADHLNVIAEYAPGLRIDSVIADPRAVARPEREDFERSAANLGATITYGHVRREAQQDVHDPLRLAISFSEVFHA